LVGRKIYVYSSENTSKQPYIAVKYHNFDNAAHDSVINQASADFDKNTSATGYKDISVTVTLNGNSLRAIYNGTNLLQQGTDYSVSGNMVTIKKEYIENQPVGNTNLIFRFSAGNDQTFAINVSDSSDNSESDSSGDSNYENTQNSDSDDITIIKEDNGVVQAVIEEGMFKKLMDQSVADGDTGIRKITIDVPKEEGAKTYEILLPTAAVTAGDETIYEVGLNTELAALTLPANMLKPSEFRQTSDVTFEVRTADKESISVNTKAAIGEHPFIELNIKVDGKNISWNNPEAPVRVSIPYKPTASELKDSEHIIVQYIDGYGNLIPISNSRYNTDTEDVTFTTAHFGQYAISYTVKSFDDIETYSWAKKEIEVLASRGIIKGTSEKAFDPGDNISRADFIVLLIRTLGLNAKVENNFSDVKPDDYYYEALGIAKKLGIADGTGNNIFNPETRISRQDMMVITARALREIKKLNTDGTRADLDAFHDRGQISAYAAEDLSAMIKSGLIKGNDDMINPLSNTTRAEAAVLMYRIFNK